MLFQVLLTYLPDESTNNKNKNNKNQQKKKNYIGNMIGDSCFLFSA